MLSIHSSPLQWPIPQDPPPSATTDSTPSGSEEAIPALRLAQLTAVKEDIKVQKQAVPAAVVQSHHSPRQEKSWVRNVWPILQWLLMGSLLLAVFSVGVHMPNSLGSNEYWSSKVSLYPLAS